MTKRETPDQVEARLSTEAEELDIPVLPLDMVILAIFDSAEYTNPVTAFDAAMDSSKERNSVERLVCDMIDMALETTNQIAAIRRSLEIVMLLSENAERYDRD